MCPKSGDHPGEGTHFSLFRAVIECEELDKIGQKNVGENHRKLTHHSQAL